MNTKFLAASILLVALSSIPAPARAEEGETGKESAKSSEHKITLRRRTVDDKEQLKPEAMLSDLRDTRLSVGQVKQQAVNLFLEATRVVIKPGSQALHVSPTSINATMLNEKANYMEPRKDWLIYYMNTLEPIIQLLTDDIHDVDTNSRVVPANIEAKINPIWKTWKSDITSINRSLDEMQELIGQDSGTNIPLAKTALEIYQRASNIEKIRYRAFELLSQEYALAELPKNKTLKKGKNNAEVSTKKNE